MNFSKQLEKLFAECPMESKVGGWLKKNPILLSRVVGGRSYANQVVAEFQFGTEYRADFVAVGSYSGGCEVHFVELEGPCDRLFTKDGRTAKKLNEAISQIDDWKRFVEKNRLIVLQELSKSMRKKELVFNHHDETLTDNRGTPIYHPNLWVDFDYIIIIGRRNDLTKYELEKKASFFYNHNVHVMTYDRILDSAIELDKVPPPR